MECCRQTLDGIFKKMLVKTLFVVGCVQPKASSVFSEASRIAMAATTDADEAVAAAKAKLAELYEVHDHFFCADKAEKQVRFASCLARRQRRVEQAPSARRRRRRTRRYHSTTYGLLFVSWTSQFAPHTCVEEYRQLRATVFYLKGKALDAFPSYDATAEQLLSQAVRPFVCLVRPHILVA